MMMMMMMMMIYDFLAPAMDESGWTASLTIRFMCRERVLE
jgi:hypothetical protein